MRRKTAKTLADLGRLIPLTACLFAASVAWVWTHHPSEVVRFEVRLRHFFTSHLWGAWEAAKRATEPDVQRVLLEGLAKDLGYVRNQDHLAYILEDCHTRLIALAEARGDLALATKWARASVAFDERSVLAMVRLGRLLCAQPSSCQDGLDQLSTLARKFPGNPHVTSALALALAVVGKGEQALAVLDAADAVPQSNAWVVHWDAGQGFSDRFTSLIPTVEQGRLRLRFDIVDRCRALRFSVPTSSSFRLVQPTLRVVADGQAQVVDLLGAAALCTNMARNGSRLEALGRWEANIEVVLPKIAAGKWEFTLEADWQRRRSTVFAAPTVGVAMNEWRDALVQRGDTDTLGRLQSWRDVARAGLQVDLCYRAGEDAFSDARRVTAFVEPSPGGGTAVAFAVDHAASELRIHLPGDAVGLTYEWVKLEVVIDGRAVELDPRAMVLLDSQDIERRDGTFVSTGIDPRFSFAIPSGRQVSSVRIGGRP